MDFQRRSCLLTVMFMVVGCVRLCCGLVVDNEGDSTTRLDALEYMLIEEKQLRSKLEAKVTSLETTINRLDSYMHECDCNNGQHQTHPAFLASFLSSSGFDCSAMQPILFDDVKLNSASAYNPNHGTFTAPVSGYYEFQVSLAAPGHTWYTVAIVQNVTSNEIGYLFNQDMSVWTKRSTSTVTHLNAGEEVWMICLATSHFAGNIGHAWHGAGDYHSHFSGFLIGTD